MGSPMVIIIPHCFHDITCDVILICANNGGLLKFRLGESITRTPSAVREGTKTSRDSFVKFYEEDSPVSSPHPQNVGNLDDITAEEYKLIAKINSIRKGWGCLCEFLLVS